MDSIRHAFSKSSASSSPVVTARPRDGVSEITVSKTPTRGDSMSSKRDSGLGKSALSALGSTNGRNHSRKPSGASSSRSQEHSFASNGSLNVSDRLEAILARTDELDAANVAHLAQSISEVRGKSHGLHGIHPGVLANEASPPGSSHQRSSTQQDLHFSVATLARTRKVKHYYDMRMTGMRVSQNEGKQWNLLQCLRDREVRRKVGDQLDMRLLEGRTRESSKATSVSSFGTPESIGEGKTRGRKRHSSPVQPIQRGHIRQQSSRQNADRFRLSIPALENWSVTPEEVIANFGWQQANRHRQIDRHGNLINPLTDDERRSDGVHSNSSSFDYDRTALTRHSTEGTRMSPMSSRSPIIRTSSLKVPLRNVPSFAMSTATPNRSRSPSPVRGAKHTRQTSDLLDIPQRVRRKIHDKIKGDRSAVSSRAPSPNRSDSMPTHLATADDHVSKTLAERSSTLPLRIDIDMLSRRPTISRRPKPTASSHQHEARRELARTRARLTSTGIATRGMLATDTHNTDFLRIASCQRLMETLAGLQKSITTTFEHDFPKATSNLNASLSTVESRQRRLADNVQSSLTKTRKETSVKIADIAAEQTSTLLLQLKAVEDKMDALEYRANSGWTHEKTLHLVFLVLEYIVMVVLWHLWVLLSILRLGKRVVMGAWVVLWAIVGGIIRFIRWLFFINP